ncbi:MAG: DoxX family membrane protein [Candidatus Pacebacteria bacterium]|nr:DoxX family membrane protein [Candidatus Paceibacterota bacterium]
MNTLKSYIPQLPSFAPVVLRLGIAGVVIWFGTSQLLSQAMWTSFIPDWVISLTHLSATTLVFINGLFEVVAGGLVALGFCVRPLATLLFLHMIGIIASVGLSPIGIRDIGIATGLLSVALYGNDILSWKSPASTSSSV